MIVEQSKKAFVPVTITLETEEELEMMINSMSVEDNETLADTAEKAGFDGDVVDTFEADLCEELKDLIK